MSKQPKIRWRESDDKEIARVLKNYNAKIDRLLKKDPSKIKNSLPKGMTVNKNALPTWAMEVKDEYGNKDVVFTYKITKDMFKDLVNTRQDLKRELNSLRRFTKRGAEEVVLIPGTDYNLQITKWQKEEMNRSLPIINRRRADRLQDIADTKVKGYNYTLGQVGMGRQSDHDLRPTKAFTKSMSQTDLKWKFASIRKERQTSHFTERDYALRNNYIKGLRENYSEEDVKDIIEKIEKMDIKQFLKNFRAVDLNTFDWASGPPSEEEYGAYVQRLRTEWIPEEAKTTPLDVTNLEGIKTLIGSGNYVNLFNDGRLLGSYKDFDKLEKRLKRYKYTDKFSYNITR